MPATLRKRIEEALEQSGPDLMRAAERLLEEARNGDAGRSTALTLLAADALVTYACELAAESRPESLGELR